MKLKLNKRRTLLIAFAFFGVLMLWQIYFYYGPLFLTKMLIDKFGHDDEYWANIVGHIMSIDNLSAIIIIPLFGWLSDRTHTYIGKRMPYIIWGCIVSLVLFPMIAVMYLINAFVWYFVVVALLVIAMATFRSPAVSLMPDVTPKPLRTEANAIINFVGYLGAIVASGLTMIFTVSKDGGSSGDNLTIIPFIITSIIMIIIVVVFLLKFFENKTVASMKAELAEGERQAQTFEHVQEGKPLSKRDKLNFGILIAAVFFCWFAFNALQTFGSLYGQNILIADGGTNMWGMCSAALAIASLIAFLPSIWVTKWIGRKWASVMGPVIVVTALVLAALFVSHFGWLIYVLFAVSGIGWALVMVNSYPMFVEMSHGKNIGRVTSLYYFVSQGAMFITSNVSGYVFKYVGYKFYFWYAVIFMACALFVAFFVVLPKRVPQLKQK